MATRGVCRGPMDIATHNRKWRFVSFGMDPGFTMIELVVALVIFAIIAGVGIPQLTRWNQAYRLGGAVRELISDMQYARVKAIRNNKAVVVTFTASGYTAVSDGTTIRNVTLPKGVKITIPTGITNDEIAFNNRGYAVRPPGTATSAIDTGSVAMVGRNKTETLDFKASGKVVVR